MTVWRRHGNRNCTFATAPVISAIGEASSPTNRWSPSLLARSARLLARVAGSLACVAAVFVSGCTYAPDETGGTRINQRNFDAIHSDMTTRDLVALFGEPTETAVASRAMDYAWTWKDGDKWIEVIFEPTGHVDCRGKSVLKRAGNLE